MYGGNDGLNTLVPMRAARRRATSPTAAGWPAHALPIAGSSYGLHPNLPFLKSLYDRGNVGVVQGVGYSQPDFSHFNSMAIWMRGLNAVGPPTSGWLGRWLDGVSGFDAFRGATIGTNVPLHLIGQSRRATGIPVEPNAFGTGDETSDVRMFAGLRHYADASSRPGHVPRRDGAGGEVPDRRRPDRQPACSTCRRRPHPSSTSSPSPPD